MLMTFPILSIMFDIIVHWLAGRKFYVDASIAILVTFVRALESVP